jgi:hypothetical protein
LSYSGAEIGRVNFTDALTAFSAAGRVCAVIETGGLTRFRLDGTELTEEYLGQSDARGIIISENERILLLYSNYAEWYNES